MASALQSASSAIENIPGYNEAMFVWGAEAPDIVHTKDPFFVTGPNGDQSRRKAPENITRRDKKVWKRIISKAWSHDRNFCGCTGTVDLGVGQAPLVSLIPIIGPICMYVLHARILSLADELQVPSSLHAKMAANILFDFIITLTPVLGALFSWMNACSTRNAALIDTWVRHKAVKDQEQRGPFELVDGRHFDAHQNDVRKQQTQRSVPMQSLPSSNKGVRIGTKASVGQQQSGVL